MKDKTTISDVVSYFEEIAPFSLQESYDNACLQTGDPSKEVTSVLVTLDVNEEVIEEAEALGANLIVTHHPVIFGGLKRLTGKTHTERSIIRAVRNNISILAVHTNLDNIKGGVNTMIAGKLGLDDCKILRPLKGKLRKLVTFIPLNYVESVRSAVFSAGAGETGNYDQCGFTMEGEGTFRGNNLTHPFAGSPGKLHAEKEARFETIFPEWAENRIIHALIRSHPYEEVAYDIFPLTNEFGEAGSGIYGELTSPVKESVFLENIKEIFNVPVIRHSRLSGKPVRKVAVCGGAGSFLLEDAVTVGADFFITGDIKYHQFSDASGKIVMADIGHFESEQFTKELFYELLTKKFSTFAVRLSGIITNPVRYFL